LHSVRAVTVEDVVVANRVKDVLAYSVTVVAAANSVNDVIVAYSVTDAIVASSVEDVALFERTFKEPLLLELEASSIKDLVALMLYIPPLFTCFPLSTRAINI
jgi:hypothetical protein